MADALRPYQQAAPLWELSHRGDKAALPIADRHYNRQHVGSPQFVPPGRCIVLLTPDRGALWVTSWPFAQYVKHAWAGAWVCSLFRRERGAPASVLISAAVAATRAIYGDPPAQGFVTFIDRKKVTPIMRRGVPVWGYTWLRCGWHVAGETKGGLLALALPYAALAAVAPLPPATKQAALNV